MGHIGALRRTHPIISMANKLNKMRELKLIRDSDGNNTVGYLLSKPEVDDVLLVITREGEAVRFGIITNIIKAVIKTDVDVYTLHDNVPLKKVSGKNLYLSAKGKVMAMEPFANKYWTVAATDGSFYKAGEDSLFEL